MTDIASLLKEGMKQQLSENYVVADNIYRQILAIEPEQPDALHLLGLVLDQQQRTDEGVLLIEKAISLLPNTSSFHHNIAGIYRKIGRLEESERAFREAIRLNPAYPEAYQGLAEMVTFSREDPFHSAVIQQLSSKTYSPEKKAYLEFSLGKYYDDIGDYDLAFRSYHSGNTNAGKNFKSEEFSTQIKNQLYLYDNHYISQIAGCGNDSEMPVFVVGMPRSGTSLVEQILATHSKVFGAGELNDMKHIVRQGHELSALKNPWPNFLPGLSSEHTGQLAEEYLDRIKKLNTDAGASMVVDKHPLNFQFVGLIFTLFPKAKIIHTVRHPLDTCLSCFFQNFSKGQEYSFDLHKLGLFYNNYRRLMEHWNLCFPGRILDVHYEKLVGDKEVEIPRMLEYLGLEFEPACLEFYKTRREIKTASFLQVRKPIYRTSENRWKNYASHLQELAELIHYPIPDPVTISQPVTIYHSRIPQG